MTQWGAFLGLSAVVLGFVLVLAHLTQRAVTDEFDEDVSTPAVFGNVVVTHGLLGALLVGAALYTEIPPSAFGLERSGGILLLGVGLGVALFAMSEGSAAIGDRLSLEHDESLRTLLAPESLAGWLVLAGLVLPLVAVVEELLFRAIVIGVLSTASGISPWLLVVPGAMAFGLGHGLQGRLGVLVTALLGVVLGVAYVVTDSLASVVVAHYLVNLLEFVRHERPGQTDPRELRAPGDTDSP